MNTIICECAYCESELHPPAHLVSSSDALRQCYTAKCKNCGRINRLVARESRGALVIITTQLTLESETIEASDMAKSLAKAVERRIIRGKR